MKPGQDKSILWRCQTGGARCRAKKIGCWESQRPSMRLNFPRNFIYGLWISGWSRHPDDNELTVCQRRQLRGLSTQLMNGSQNRFVNQLASIFRSSSIQIQWKTERGCDGTWVLVSRGAFSRITWWLSTNRGYIYAHVRKVKFHVCAPRCNRSGVRPRPMRKIHFLPLENGITMKYHSFQMGYRLQ
jgi:hypothetical protein